jgi:hypothetical protein
MSQSYHRENFWSPEEIDALKRGFLDGTPTKLLSLRLGRSISALNKALSRFSIRNKRRRPSKNKAFHGDIHIWRSLEFNRNTLSKEFRERDRKIGGNTALNIEKDCSTDTAVDNSSVHREQAARSVRMVFTQHEWTSMDCVIKFLMSQGYNITMRIFPDKTVAYFFNRTVITETRLLIMANSIRLDMKKPIFVIRNANM